MNQVLDFISDPNWHESEKLSQFFAWATSPEVEQCGEGRRQLGYYDGYNNSSATSRNSDYLKGYAQGQAMRSCAKANT